MKRPLLNLLTLCSPFTARGVSRTAAVLFLVSIALCAAVIAPGKAYLGSVILAGYLSALACGCVVIWAVASFVATPSSRRVAMPWRLFRRQRLLDFLCGISLLTCVGMCALWILSQRQGYAVIFYNGTGTDYAAASQGNWVAFGTEPRSPGQRSEVVAGDIPLGSAVPRHPFAAVPHAVLVLASAVLPAVWATRRRRQILAAWHGHHGRCPTCGYDLRATPGRCPECGRRPPESRQMKPV
jgi:hypothetical protein